MTPEQKEWIDKADYETLLRRWRNAPVGDSIFQCDAGEYYKEVMNKKRSADPAGHVAASKEIGWSG